MAKKPSIKKAKLGQKIQDFILPSTAGSDFDSKEFRGKNLILYFYPKDSTPGCTTEGIEFSQLMTQFRKLKTEVFGISRDSLPSHDKFKCRYDFKLELLSDGDELACELFDVIKEKNMYGKKVMGIERSTFYIDQDGVLQKEWRKVKAQGHAAEVLEFLKNLKSK